MEDIVCKEKTAFKGWCDSHGYTARYVAEAIGVSIHTVHSYLQGVRYPSRKTMKALEEAFDMDTREIFKL